MSYQSNPLVQYWSNCPPSPTNSVFLDTMETTLVAPVEQHRITTFLPRRFLATTPPVSPALISSMSQNFGFVTPVPGSNSSNGWGNVDQSVFQLPPTPKSPNSDRRSRNLSTSSEISTENTSAEIIKNGICEKESVMKVKPRLRARDDRSSCSSSESSEVKKFCSKAFTKWLQSMVTVSKHLDNYKNNLEYTVKLLKNWPENHQETAKLIVDEIRRRMNTAENSCKNAKAAYLHILLVDKILRDQDVKIEYAKFFKKYKLMAEFDEVFKSLAKNPDKQSTLLKIKKYWEHLFSKRDIVSFKKKDTVTTNSAPHFYEINNSDPTSPQLHSASTKVIKEKYSTPGKIVKASNLDQNQCSQKNKTLAEYYLTDPRLKQLPNYLPAVPHKLTNRPVSPLQTNILPLVNINERTDNIPVVSQNNSGLVSAKTRNNNPLQYSGNSPATVPPNNSLLDPAKIRTNNPTGFSANCPVTVPPNNSLLVYAKTGTNNPTRFSANSLATVPPNNSLLDPAKTRTNNRTGFSANSLATVPPNNSPLDPVKTRTNNRTGSFANSPATVPPSNSLLNPAKSRTNNPPGFSANSPATVPSNNSLLVSAKTRTNNRTGFSANSLATVPPNNSPLDPAKTRTNNSPVVSANIPATVPPNNSLLVSAKTVTNNLPMVSETANDSLASPALQSKTNYSFEDELSDDPNSWEDIMIDIIKMEQAKSEINSKKDSKKRKDTKDSQLTSSDSEINERRKKSDNKETTSVKQQRPNQDIQVNPTLPEQPDFLSITSPSPKYYCDENICEDKSSHPSEVTTSIPFQIAQTENTDISACSSIQSNDATNISDLKRPEMIMEPLPPLPFPSEGTNYLWEEENLSQRFPLKCTKDDSFEICDLVDKIHHCYINLKRNVTFREVYDADGNGSIQIWHC